MRSMHVSAQRGQSAAEYLITYGWAILVVMIIGVVLWQLGFLQGEGQIPTTSTGFPKLKPVLADTGLTELGDFGGSFVNAAGGPITVYSVLVNNSGPAVVCEPVTPASPVYVAATETLKATASGCGTGDPGEPYTLLVNINYSVLKGTRESIHSDSGSIHGSYEPG